MKQKIQTIQDYTIGIWVTIIIISCFSPFWIYKIFLIIISIITIIAFIIVIITIILNKKLIKNQKL